MIQEPIILTRENASPLGHMIMDQMEKLHQPLDDIVVYANDRKAQPGMACVFEAGDLADGIELLPCPFCGCSKVYWDWYECDGEMSSGWRCKQSSCGADGPRELFPRTQMERAMRQTADMWNHRAGAGRSLPAGSPTEDGA